MIQELQDFGLSEKEAKVYYASLEIGKATADQLAKQAKINRSTTYVQIESLKKKGLMSEFVEGKKTFFVAESPELLKRLFSLERTNLDQKEKTLSSFLPEMLRVFNQAGERPVVRLFDGKEGVAAVREEILKTKDKQIFVIFSPGHLSQIFTQAELDNYSDRREALGIESIGIYTYEAYFNKATDSPLTKRRFLSPDKLKLDINIVVYDNKVAILALKGKLFGMIIESKEISSSMRSIFDFLWLAAQKK